MIPLKFGKTAFALLTGKISIDSYSTTIKKLTLAQQKGFVQIVPARLVAGKRHIAAALEHALFALGNGTAFSKNLELEFLIRLLGEKQLNTVLKNVQFGNEEVAIVARMNGGKKPSGLMEEFNFKEIKNFKFGKNKKRLMGFYKISEKALETLSDAENALEELVIEKISFVELER